MPAVEPTELLGAWTLARRIVDRPVDGGAPQFGRVDGTLTLAADGDDVAWCEQGVLTWNDQHLPVTRRHVVRREGDGLDVCFDDGRPVPPLVARRRRSSTSADRTRTAGSSTSPPTAGRCASCGTSAGRARTAACSPASLGAECR